MNFTDKQMLEAVSRYYYSRSVKYYIGGSKYYEKIIYGDSSKKEIWYHPDGEVYNVKNYNYDFNKDEFIMSL